MLKQTTHQAATDLRALVVARNHLKVLPSSSPIHQWRPGATLGSNNRPKCTGQRPQAASNWYEGSSQSTLQATVMQRASTSLRLCAPLQFAPLRTASDITPRRSSFRGARVRIRVESSESEWIRELGHRLWEGLRRSGCHYSTTRLGCYYRTTRCHAPSWAPFRFWHRPWRRERCGCSSRLHRARPARDALHRALALALALALVNFHAQHAAAVTLAASAPLAAAPFGAWQVGKLLLARRPRQRRLRRGPRESACAHLLQGGVSIERSTAHLRSRRVLAIGLDFYLHRGLQSAPQVRIALVLRRATE